jgi:ubiquinol-cytochrome c reductase subunit 8
LTGSQPQKGIITYGLSSNRQNAFAGAAHDAVFNTARRTSQQIFYWAPALLTAYYVLNWATER